MNICQEFVAARNLKFGTNADPSMSKTKCIIFTKKNISTEKYKPIELDGNELPWVTNVKHLGHILQKDNSMKLDIAKKRGTFIGKTNSLLQEFSNVPHEAFLKIFQSYVTNLYGSNLWDLFGKECEKLYTSYNVAIRNILKVDRCTHRYLIEAMSEIPHLKSMLCSRFVTFHQSLRKSPKFPVRFLSKLVESDLRTVHGKNLAGIASKCDLNEESPNLLRTKLVKEKLIYQ